MERIRLLFVCLGNICRSPAAQAVMQRLVDERGLSHLFYINSAGIGGWHIGQLPDKRMRLQGSARGYLFDHRAQQLRREDFDRYDYLIGMDEENIYDMRRLCNSQKKAKKIICLADYLQKYADETTIPDPYYGGTKDFVWALDLIEDACEGLLDSLLQKQPL
ncbi:MAG: low molecular weight phosphotyrosine protein phosphatase [Prevotella sp.]|nr:low molecular weight phosphotyrosine protein phosphatase [Prevotella sp.]